MDVVRKPVWAIRLESVQKKLGKAERRVAEYLTEDPNRIISLSITEFAEACGSSEATIVRFCHHIGCKGFQDLKLSIAQDVVSPIQVMYDGIDPNDSVGIIKKKVFYSSIQAMQDTIEIVSDEELQRAADAICRAQKFDIFGMGGSGVLAQDAQHKFMKIGLRVNVFSDTHLQALSVSQLRKGDVALAISYSGASRDVIESLEIAKRNGATTICITHMAKSPITRVADIKLYTTARETMFRSDGIVSRMAQLAIIDTLYMTVSLQLGKQASESLELGRQAMAGKGY